MIQKIAMKIVKICWNEGIVHDDLDVYIYGSELVISSFLGILLSLLSGVILGNFFDTVLFLFLFILLRRYTGGYHASSHFNCIFGTSLLSILLNILIYIQFPIKVTLLLAILNGIIIIFLCPINNQFIHSIHSNRYYKSQSTKLLTIYLLLASISSYYLPNFSLTLSYIIITVSLLMILEVIKNEKNENNYFI